MGRTIPAALASVILDEQNAPLELYEIYLDDQTYYYVNAEQDIVLGVQTYTAIGISRTRISTTIDSKVDEISVQLDNVDKGFTQLIQSKELQGKRIIVKKAFRGYLGSAVNIIVLFDGRIDMLAIDQQKVQARIVSWLNAVTKKYPGRMFQAQCNHKFGDTWCTIDKDAVANKVTGTADAGTTTTLIDAALTQAGDYWKDGVIKITGGTNIGLSRQVRVFDAVTDTLTFRLGFPVAIDDTSQYTLYRGCNKTQNICVNTYNNWQHYGGYTTIPKKPLV